MTRKRPDAITISLGGYTGNHQEQREALEKLAGDLNLIGQRGPSISHLMRWLADVYDQAPKELAELLEIAGDAARGGDLYEQLTNQ